MSNIHYQNLDNEYNECALCIDPWPCPPAVAEVEQRDARRAELWAEKDKG